MSKWDGTSVPELRDNFVNVSDKAGVWPEQTRNLKELLIAYRKQAVAFG
jgi:hypothetical protein